MQVSRCTYLLVYLLATSADSMQISSFSHLLLQIYLSSTSARDWFAYGVDRFWLRLVIVFLTSCKILLGSSYNIARIYIYDYPVDSL